MLPVHHLLLVYSLIQVCYMVTQVACHKGKVTIVIRVQENANDILCMLEEVTIMIIVIHNMQENTNKTSVYVRGRCKWLYIMSTCRCTSHVSCTCTGHIFSSTCVLQLHVVFWSIFVHGYDNLHHNVFSHAWDIVKLVSYIMIVVLRTLLHCYCGVSLHFIQS